MPYRTQRAHGDSNRPTYGATMLPGESPSKAGLNINSDGQPEIWNAAGTVVLDLASASVTVPMVFKLAVTAGDGAGVIAEAANPFGYDVIITNAVLDITTQSTGASTLDIGVAATDTSNDSLLDGVSGAAAGRFNNVNNAGTNGKSGVLWTSSTYLTVAEASGDVTALVGTLYVTCYRRI